MRNATTMRRLGPVFVAGTLTAGLLAFAAAANPAAAACRSLNPIAAESLFTIWQQSVATRNIGRLGELYAADAIVLGPATGEPATTTPAHRRELASLIALGPMKALKRTVATGCESIRDYGTMTEVGATGGRRAELRYSRVYELRDGRWLITLEHISAATGNGATIASLIERQQQRPVAAVAGYMKALPSAHDPIASVIQRSELGGPPVAAASPMLMTPPRQISSGPVLAAGALSPPVAAPVAVASRPQPRFKKYRQPGWSQDLPGFRTRF